LGVSRCIIFTYNHLLPIHWKPIQRLLLDEYLQGGYLQTFQGKNTPRSGKWCPAC